MKQEWTFWFCNCPHTNGSLAHVQPRARLSCASCGEKAPRCEPVRADKAPVEG